MDKINSILSEIQTEMLQGPLGIKREILMQNIVPQNDLVVAIQGIRRCGKSTLLRQIAHEQGILEKAFFINFEDPRLSDILDYRLLDQIVKFHETNSNSAPVFFLDEIQNVDQWEKWLHIQVEKKKRSFVITGSNSTLLSGKLGTSLTGRHLTYEVYPFSFSEYKKIKPETKLVDYLNDGGFPRALSFSAPEKLLREYFSDIIERDVRRHVAARSSQSLSQLAKALFESTGSETSLRKMANIFEISPETVRKYIEAFESAYLCLPCPYFTYSERKSAVRPKKYYPIDLGMHSAIVTKTGMNLGKKLETVVFHSLLKKYSKVFYWKGKGKRDGEVDFVVETREGTQPIQVSFDGKEDRHIKACAEFLDEHPRSLPPIYISQDNVEEFI